LAQQRRSETNFLIGSALSGPSTPTTSTFGPKWRAARSLANHARRHRPGRHRRSCLAAFAELSTAEELVAELSLLVSHRTDLVREWVRRVYSVDCQW
jgi:hypothetical protein